MSGLTIYRASAGSGKTFAITREYIHLLFREPENYRRILCVTFTNKATAEMKGRILAELDKLSRGQQSGYSAELSEAFHFSPSQLKQRASEILSRLLHDYSHFNILTIDSFFQRIIRSFAREIGFYQGFDIELDQHKILTAAIDEMIFELGANQELREWLVRFAEDRIVEGANWNINREIENLGQEVFKEKFSEVGERLIEKITEKSFLHDFGEHLNGIRKSFETEVHTKAKGATEIMQMFQLTSDDFKGKSRSVGNFFEKLLKTEKFSRWEISPTIRAHFNDPDRWPGNDKTKTPTILQAYREGLNRLLGEIINIADTSYPFYKSALAVQKHYYVLGVVADLLKHIRQYSAGRNIFLISDTTRFLNKLIGNADAPFVYERTGMLIRHFMIDEFQDTSVMQWHNFQPLILNSLAEGNENWIVGDVKQSVYRWRNSDWTIFSRNITNDLQPYEAHIKPLEYNWRSAFPVVQFNNSFFSNAISVLSNESLISGDESENSGTDHFRALLGDAYNHFAQIVPENRRDTQGLVRIELIPTSNGSDLTFQELALGKIPSLLEHLQDLKYSLRDIAILVRTRKEGDSVSAFLLNYQKQRAGSGYRYDILSNDSLLLKNSEVVQWMISAFRYITHPEEELNKAFLEYEYDQYILENSTREDFHDLFTGGIPGDRDTLLTDFFAMGNLRHASVYELSDKLIRHFELFRLKGELPFIQAFQDMLQEYSRKAPADLNSFLQWWDENLDKRVISMPEEQDAVRLMTIHKSKGLEFKIVILPFGEWTMMKSGINSNILWCRPEVEPLNTLDLVPVSLSRDLEGTVFSNEYFYEKGLSFVDNLNLLYVAFTRAIEGLYVFSPESGKGSVENNIGNLVNLALKTDGLNPSEADFPALRFLDYWDETSQTFLFGTLPEQTPSDAGDSGSLDIGSISYIAGDVSAIAQQVIRADTYFPEDSNELTRINRGKLMHEVFQQIKTAEDVDKALLLPLLEGKISDQERASLAVEIKEFLNQPSVKDWFSTDWEIVTERDILLPDGSTVRPDRVLMKKNNTVVIDYKFGVSESESHIWQVRKYMKYLRQINPGIIEGFVWYVRLGKIIPVSTAIPVQGKLF